MDQYDSIATGCSDADKNAIKDFFRKVDRNLDSTCAHRKYLWSVWVGGGECVGGGSVCVGVVA